jgi:hypothetical protein
MTITSNIFYNLTAWASGQTVAIGANRASGANAYRATSAGTTGANAPSGTSASFNDGGVTWKYLAPIDYTSLVNWAASVPSTLTQQLIALVWNTGEVVIQGPLLTLNVTTTAANNIVIKCAPGESFYENRKTTDRLFYDPTKGVAFKNTQGTYGRVLDIITDYYSFDGIQVYNAVQYDMSISPVYTTGGRFTNCFILNRARGNNDRGVNVSNNNNTSIPAGLFNCVVVNMNSDGSACAVNLQSTAYVVNSTIVFIPEVGGTVASGSTRGAVDTSYNLPNIINTAMFGFVMNTTDTGQPSTNMTNNASDITQDIGSSSLLGIDPTTVFESFTSNLSTMDLRLKSNSPLLDKGSTSASAFISTDIAGTPRPQNYKFDIGAYELIQAALARLRTQMFVIT